MKEEWKDVKGMGDFVEVSTKGRIRTKDRFITRNNQKVLQKGTIRKCQDNGKGYMQFKISIDRKIIRKYVHVMVAEAFLVKRRPNQTEVNHKNGDKKDNIVENLEWVTRQENMNHAIKTGLIYTPHRESIKNIQKVKCGYCGGYFKLNTYNQKFCTVKCSALNQKGRHRGRKVKRPNMEDLYEILKTRTFKSVGEDYGVTDNAVRRWCKDYNIPYKASYYSKNYRKL